MSYCALLICSYFLNTTSWRRRHSNLNQCVACMYSRNVLATSYTTCTCTSTTERWSFHIFLKKKRLSKLFLTRLKISKSTKFELYLRWFVELSVCDRRWKSWLWRSAVSAPATTTSIMLEMAKMQTREESPEGEFCTHEWMEQRVRFVLCRVTIEDTFQPSCVTFPERFLFVACVERKKGEKKEWNAFGEIQKVKIDVADPTKRCGWSSEHMWSRVRRRCRSAACSTSTWIYFVSAQITLIPFSTLLNGLVLLETTVRA